MSWCRRVHADRGRGRGWFSPVKIDPPYSFPTFSPRELRNHERRGLAGGLKRGEGRGWLCRVCSGGYLRDSPFGCMYVRVGWVWGWTVFASSGGEWLCGVGGVATPPLPPPPSSQRFCRPRCNDEKLPRSS